MKTQLLYLVLGLLIFGGCKTIHTNLTIPEKKMPESFTSTAGDSLNMAKINWRNYFTDTLLQKLIDTALVSNLDLQIALQRIEIARSAIGFATGKLLPEVSAGGYAGADKYAKYTQEYAGNSTTLYEPGKTVPNPLPNFNLGLQTTWEIDIWKKLRNQRQATLLNWLASIEGKNFVVSNLVAEVAIAYYKLLALDNELAIIQQTIQKQEEALEVVKYQKETGRANELAVQQFQAQLLNTQTMEKETQQLITETENKINFLSGRYPQTIPRNKEILFSDIPSQLSIGLPSQLLTNRPDIREAEFQVEASKFDLKAAKAAFFPTLNITAALGFQSFNPKFLFLTPASVTYSALGGLAAPVINRKALKARYHTARAGQLTAMYNYQRTILNAYVEVRNQLLNVQRLQEINSLKRQESETLTNSVETSTELYRAAKANYLEVLIAQQSSLRTQLELIEVNKRRQIATVNIYKALGGGW